MELYAASKKIEDAKTGVVYFHGILADEKGKIFWECSHRHRRRPGRWSGPYYAAECARKHLAMKGRQ